MRYQKSADLLVDSGALAIVETQHVLPAGGDPFWVEVQADYDQLVPSDGNRPPPAPELVPDLRHEIESSGYFTSTVVRRHAWDVTYTAYEYVAVLDTYSGHRSMEESTRSRLYDRIRRRIEARQEPTVTKTYLATLNVAYRRSRP